MGQGGRYIAEASACDRLSEIFITLVQCLTKYEKGWKEDFRKKGDSAHCTVGGVSGFARANSIIYIVDIGGIVIYVLIYRNERKLIHVIHYNVN